MDKIKRFVECLLPLTQCNIACHYCYVIQENRRAMKPLALKFTPEVIGRSLRQERMGGICYFSICGAGETLLPKEVVAITREILKQGHYVNLTTNGTVTKRFEELMELPKEYLSRLHFSFSFHYLELVKKKLLDRFFDNIDLVRSRGCSFFVQFNLNDAYVEHLDEMKKLCLDRLGALPQVCATRDESVKHGVKLYTSKTLEEYKKIGDEFHSPLFEYTMKNFMVKRKEFCYAGDWSMILNLETGQMRPCYGSIKAQYIFDDPEKPIRFEALGKNCRSTYCYNSSHYMSLGVIPQMEGPGYGELRNRKEAHWYTDRMDAFLNSRLRASNMEYSKGKKLKVTMKNKVLALPERLFVYLHNL